MRHHSQLAADWRRRQAGRWGSSHRRAGRAAWLLAIGLACGGDRHGGPDAGQAAPAPPAVEMPAECSGPEIALEDYLTCEAHAACALDLRCEYRFSSLEDCLAHYPTDTRSNTMAAVARGTMTYDPEVAAECIQSAVEGACTTPSNVSCRRRSFAGALADGDPCYLDLECGRGGECSGCAPEECCQGTCFIPDEVGESCTEFGTCALDLVCDPSSRTCMPRRPAECSSDTDCTADERCDGSGNCLRAAAEGEPCEFYGYPRLVIATADSRDNSDCAPGLACVDSVCARTDHVGAPCETYDQCWGGLQCRFDPAAGRDTCRARSAIGEPCNDELLCLGSSRCDEATGRCVALSGTGEPCDGNWECAGTLRCYFDDKVCGPARPLGAACRRGTEECDVGLHCGPDSTCVSSACPP